MIVVDHTENVDLNGKVDSGRELSHR